MKYCCPGMEHYCQNVGKQGFSVYTRKHLDEPLFQLEFRGIDLELQARFSGMMATLPKTDPPFEFVIAAPIVITFCPWCGRKLKRAYLKTWEKLIFRQGVATSEDQPAGADGKQRAQK